MLQRITLGVAAVLAAAWLAVAWHDTRLLDAAESDAKALRPGAPITSIDESLERAGLLNPDRTPRFRRAALRLRAGRLEDGIGMLDAYLREEPENREAWLVLADAAKRAGDGARSREALRRFAALTSDEYRRSLQRQAR